MLILLTLPIVVSCGDDDDDDHVAILVNDGVNGLFATGEVQKFGVVSASIVIDTDDRLWDKHILDIGVEVDTLSNFSTAHSFSGGLSQDGLCVAYVSGLKPETKYYGSG